MPDLTAMLVPTATLGGLGVVFGALIAVAHRYLHVWEDPRIAGVRELLPGTDCGGCGQPGCFGFAQTLVSGEIQPAGCTVMGPDEIGRVADYLGVEAGEANRRVARLLCAGGRHAAVQRARYQGLQTCIAAAAVASGGKGCTWGCLGLADCADVCGFDAIAMNADGLPVVIPERCTACGDCVEVCPKALFVLMPVEQRLLVQCRSELEGEEAEALCSVACTGCGKCAQDAPTGVIDIVRGLAVIDAGRVGEAGRDATSRCPTGAITWVEQAQFAGTTDS
jgi:Na+-translocating ferredoxin:NAD+ oxidoreductase RNF subunit RnfB